MRTPAVWFHTVMDAELSAVREFLATHAPFDALDRAELSALVARMSTVYARRGTQIVALGAPNDTAFVVRSGAAEIRDASDALVERSDPGTTFGVSSVRSRGHSAYRIVAIEDTLLFTIPGDVFRTLLAQPALGRYFDVQSDARIRAAITAARVPRSGGVVFGVRVGDMLTRGPVTTTGDHTIREVARLMTDEGVSAALVTRDGRLAGIVTDRDLRRRVVAVGLDVDSSVSGVMTPDPLTIDADAQAFAVMLEMVARGIHHLPVVDADGVPLGLVSAGDLMRLNQSSPVYLAADIARQSSVEQLASVTGRLPRLVEDLVSSDATAADIGKATTAVIDALVRRLVALAEADLGPAPVPYCWVVMGSAGRQESGLGGDQDTALIIHDSATPADDAWFAQLAERVTAGLEACGFPRCPGDAMATNPRWRVPLARWRREFRTWMAEPEPMAVMESQIFFDMRPVCGDVHLWQELHTEVASIAPQSQRFLAHLAKAAVERTPPIGFFRAFVLERDGEHRNTLDLKHGGIAAVTQLARLYCLSRGLTAINTQARIAAAAGAGVLGSESADNLSTAFEFICYVRYRHQAAQVAAGVAPDNYVRPDDLSELDKKHLRDAFAVLRTLQGAAASSFQVGYV